MLHCVHWCYIKLRGVVDTWSEKPSNYREFAWACVLLKDIFLWFVVPKKHFVIGPWIRWIMDVILILNHLINLVVRADVSWSTCLSNPSEIISLLYHDITQLEGTCPQIHISSATVTSNERLVVWSYTQLDCFIQPIARVSSDENLKFSSQRARIRDMTLSCALLMQNQVVLLYAALQLHHYTAVGYCHTNGQFCIGQRQWRLQFPCL